MPRTLGPRRRVRPRGPRHRSDVGFSSRESQFLVRIEGETARVPVHAARACLVRDQESTFGRVNRKAINEYQFCVRTPRSSYARCGKRTTIGVLRIQI